MDMHSSFSHSLHYPQTLLQFAALRELPSRPAFSCYTTHVHVDNMVLRHAAWFGLGCWRDLALLLALLP